MIAQEDFSRIIGVKGADVKRQCLASYLIEEVYRPRIYTNQILRFINKSVCYKNKDLILEQSN